MAQYLGVRYLYESLVLPTQSNGTRSDGTQLDTTTALLLLERMPVQWREHLYQAATQVDAEKIVQLVHQIPPEHATLAVSITDLVNRYRFDRIVELTRSQA
jgi:hypothetical protein